MVGTMGIIFITNLSHWLFYQRHYEKIQKEDAIVITGSDSGLGYSLSLHCKNNLGLHVIAGVHSAKSLGSQELIKHGIDVIEIEMADLESIKSFTKSVQNLLESQKLHLRSLVNNAARMIFGEFEWLTDDHISEQIHTNFLGSIRLTKSMIPILRKHKSRLINISSHCSIEPLPGVATYAATKSAISAWSTSLRVEFKKSNISVVNFIPGSFVDSSNIFYNQKKYFDEMESSMQQETKNFYKGYFKMYAGYLSSFSKNNALKIIQQPDLYDIFDDLLMDKNPNTVYICEPMRYWKYFTLCKMAPTNIRDYLIEKFVQMPKFNE